MTEADVFDYITKQIEDGSSVDDAAKKALAVFADTPEKARELLRSIGAELTEAWYTRERYLQGA